MRINTSLLILIMGIALLEPMPAHAYLDPGTGSMLLQLLLGGIVGAAATIKLYWHRLKALFRKSPAAASDGGESDKAQG